MTDPLPPLDRAALEQLRGELDGIDAELVRLVARRQETIQAIGKVKATAGRETRDYQREKVVLDRGAALAQDAGLEPSLAVNVLRTLIQYSLMRQEQDRLQTNSVGSGKTALVIGGLGRIGRWFVSFMASQGYGVSVVDPAVDETTQARFRSLEESGVAYDVIIVAATLQSSVTVLEQLRALRPAGLIFDVGSLKSPLRAALQGLADDGLKVTSVHPMFGPSTQLLAGRQVIFVDVGCGQATAEARALFAATMATSVDMNIDEHDKVIAVVLGLSHFTGIAFVDALAGSGVSAEALSNLASPTYTAMVNLGRTIVHENPDLYYEIQRYNDFGGEPLRSLADSVARLQRAVDDGDQTLFVDAMLAGREFLVASDRRRDRAD